MFQSVQSAKSMLHRQQSLARALIGIVVVCLLATACTLNNVVPNDPNVNQVAITGAPTVRIAGPLPDTTFLENVAVNIQAQVANAGPDIARVEISVDNTIVTTIATPNTAGAATFSVAHAWPALGAGTHTINVTAFRANGSASQPASISITVSGPSVTVEATAEVEDSGIVDLEVSPEAGEDTSEEDQSGDDTQADTPPVTEEASTDEEPVEEPDDEEPDNSGPPTARFTIGVNVRSGPSTLFNPPIGSFAANQEAEITAVNPAGDWYKVRYFNSEGWVFGQLMTLEGDTSSLPVDQGPPPPTMTPIPPTAIPVTATPQSSVNLVITEVTFDPDDPDENETFTVSVTVRNDGSTRSSGGGSVRAEFTSARESGIVTGSTSGGFPPLDPGQTFESEMRMTINTYIDERHNGRFTVDANSEVAETNEGDNVATKDIDSL
ncbi:MAG: SH3 domain-containing protein [Burkholderiales bacterium]|nr:SH3 domain-containing protein [Anaerolineae bacterium]